MAKIKVKGIAPYPGLRDLLLDIAKEDDRIEMDVEIADLEEALPIVLQAEKQKYDVIVSRGGTAQLIRKHVSIPVVDIPVSGYDILRVLTLIKDSNSKPAIIGFPGICQGAATVSSLLNLEIPVYPVHHESEVRGALERATNQGAQIVLGDVVTVRTAQEMGYHGILITSGRESVQEMLTELVYVHDIYMKGQEKARFYEELLQHDTTGVLAVRANGDILYANPAAQAWLGNADAIPPAVASLLSADQPDGTTVTAEHVAIQDRLCDIRIAARTKEEPSAFVLYLQESKGVPPQPFREIQTPERLAAFAQVIGSSREIAKTVKRAQTYAQTNKSVWLTGEMGSGRMHFAQAIHVASRQGRHRFYSVCCSSAEEERLAEELFGTEGKPGLLTTASGGTLYLEEADKLSVRLQDQLAAELQKGGRLRLIASSTLSPGQVAKRGGFSSLLLHQLAECQLRIPPLRERVEDIGELARVLIAHHNSAYGKHIVGIREEVIERLAEYDWPGNLKEFENVVEEMLLLTEGHYVGLEEWQEAWQRYSAETRAGNGGLPLGGLNLEGTWEEIERQILLHVLKEEGMNQSRAAKRLGINRTTLWRKLGGVLKK